MKKILKNIKEIQFWYRFVGRAQLNSLYWVDNQKICGLKSLLKLNMCLSFPIPYEDQILFWKNDYIWNIFNLLLSTVRTLQKHVHATINNRYQKSNFFALKCECIILNQILIDQKDRKYIILFEKLKLVILILIFKFIKPNCPMDMIW